MSSRTGLVYALVTLAFWGVWGAFTGLPANHGFPETLIYCVWALTMIPPALYALHRVGWHLQTDPGSLILGLATGLLGAVPSGTKIAGIALALVAAVLLPIEPEPVTQ